MGLFNYSKPGPGIDKNAPKKKGVFLYFEILWRKLAKMCQVNMLYFICSIPMFAIYFFVSTPVISDFVNNLLASDSAVLGEFIPKITTAMIVFYMFTMVILLGSGPASASLAYIQRCFAREEHAWIWTDFFKKMKENFKQGIIVAVADIIAINMGFFAISFYYKYYLESGQIVWFFLMCILFIFLVAYVFSHYYIYQLMITFESKTKDLFKNGFILALSTMPVNIILTVLIGAICLLLYVSFEPIFSTLLSFIFVIAFLRFPFEFYAASVIKKKILNNIEEKKEEETEDLSDGSEN